MRSAFRRKASAGASVFVAAGVNRPIKPAVKNQMRVQKRASGLNEVGRLDQILFAAARLFCEQGYDATSMPPFNNSRTMAN